jgi:sialate O-acetylesterase
MVVTTDLVDNLKDIHPSYKWTIGERMAAQALNYSYGKKGNNGNHPSIKKVRKKGSSLSLSFENTGGKLQSTDGKPLNWFEVAGVDSVFYPAEAVIEKNKVKASAREVSQPMFVRFAWHETAMPNLSNAAGLPCIPFRKSMH